MHLTLSSGRVRHVVIFAGRVVLCSYLCAVNLEGLEGKWLLRLLKYYAIGCMMDPSHYETSCSIVTK